MLLVHFIDQISYRWPSASLSYHLNAIRCARIFQLILLKSRGGVAFQDVCRFCKLSRTRSFNGRFFFENTLAQYEDGNLERMEWKDPWPKAVAASIILLIVINHAVGSSVQISCRWSSITLPMHWCNWLILRISSYLGVGWEYEWSSIQKETKLFRDQNNRYFCRKDLCQLAHFRQGAKIVFEIF